MDTVLPCHQQSCTHIKYLSMYKGHINDDTQDRLKAKLVEAILKFRFALNPVWNVCYTIEGVSRLI